jgi:hypothetical protein
MTSSRMLSLTLFFVLCSAAAIRAEEPMIVGGDTYLQERNPNLGTPSARDAFVTGFTAKLSGRVEKDAHLAGFRATVDAPVNQDAYAAGFSIDVNQAIGDDLTATGFDINLNDKASVTGNARISGGSVQVDAPIQGSLVAAAAELTLNSSVAGDADLTISSLTFGPNAKIGGTLTYRATSPLTIPETVVSRDRVRFEQITTNSAVATAQKAVGKSYEGYWPGFGAAVFGLLMGLGFLSLVAALLFSFAPVTTEESRQNVASAPLKSFVLGALALSATIGLVPVGVLSIIGIPLIPVAIFASFILWVLGYVLGVYAIASRVLESYRTLPSSTLGRVFLTIVAIFAFAILNFIPVIGWFINLGAMFVGLGAMAWRALHRFVVGEGAIDTNATPTASRLMTVERRVD